MIKKRIKLGGQEFTVYAKVREYNVDYDIFEDDLGYGDVGQKPLISGFVKWDGCSNWHFPSVNDCMFHGCSRSDLTRFGELMAVCWDMTPKLCENADPSFFEIVDH